MKNIKNGDQVTVHYICSIIEDDGDKLIVDSSYERDEPLSFTVGSDTLIKGFSDIVEGAKKGDRLEGIVEPKDGYGEYKESMVLKTTIASAMDSGLTKEDLASAMGNRKAMSVNFEGAHLMGYIIELDFEGDILKIDFNPPMSGKTLHFIIEIL